MFVSLSAKMSSALWFIVTIILLNWKVRGQPTSPKERGRQICEETQLVAEVRSLVSALNDKESSTTGPLPPGFYALANHLGHDYLLDMTPVSWFQARDLCYSYGYRLARIEHEVEQLAVVNWIKNNSHLTRRDYIWIDGLRLRGGRTNCFVWTADEVSTLSSGFNYWSSLQPDDFPSGGEDCVSLYQLYDYRWNDGSCETELPFICKKRHNEVVVRGPEIGEIINSVTCP